MTEAFASIVPYAVGFILGYLSFELTEWRRRRIRLATLRRTLLAELETVEAALGAGVFRLTVGTDQVDRAVQELRRFYLVGRQRLLVVDQAPQLPPGFLERSDQELAVILREWEPLKSPLGPRVEAPALDAALASGEFPLTYEQMRALMSVRWHSQLLGQDADLLWQWLRMSFEIEEPANHALVQDNYQRALASYRQRTITMLEVVREALQKLDRNLQAR